MARVVPDRNAARTRCTSDGHEEEDLEDRHPFFERLRCLGMHSSAQKNWGLVYKKPHVACIVYFVTFITGVSSFGILHIAGFPWMTKPAHIPILVFLCVSSVQVVGMWTLGPAYGRTLFSKPFQAVGATFGVYTIAASFAGPLSFTPFQDRLVNTIWTGLSCLLMYISSACGGVAADLPPEPYQTLMTPISNSIFTALRLTDAGSDLGLMRILWEQGPSCVWFGRPVACVRYRVLAVIVGVSAGAVMVIANCAALIDGQAMLYGSPRRNRRLALLAKTVVLMCELITLSIAMVKVLSGGGRSTEVAYIALSSACTIVMFCVNAAGADRVQGVLERAAAASAASRRRLCHHRNRLSTVQPSEASTNAGGGGAAPDVRVHCAGGGDAAQGSSSGSNGGGGGGPVPAALHGCVRPCGLPVRVTGGPASQPCLAACTDCGGAAADLH